MGEERHTSDDRSREAVGWPLVLAIVCSLTLKAVLASVAVVSAWIAGAPGRVLTQDGVIQIAATLGLVGLAGVAIRSCALRRRAIAALVLLEVLATAIFVIDVVHANYYGEPPSIEELENVRFLIRIPAAIVPYLHFSLLWYLADLPLVFWLANRAARMSAASGGRRLQSPAMLLASILLVLPSVPRLVTQSRLLGAGSGVPRMIVADIGVLPYHLLDFFFAGAWRTPASTTQIDDLLSYLSRVNRSTSSALFGAARGRNVLMISAESLQTFVIGLRVDGRLVAPNLTSLASESLFFTNFYDQTHVGTTSDAEFTTLQGLHPLPVGVVSQSVPENVFHGLPRILADRGYTTVSATAEPAGFWNMSTMHAGLGFKVSWFDDTFSKNPRVGAWLADQVFFDEMTPRLAKLPEPFMAFLIASSNHAPWVLPEALRTFDVGRYRGTEVGRYLESVHYFDSALGEFVQALRNDGVLDRSVLVLYGDHQAYLEDPHLDELLGLQQQREVFRAKWLVRKGVPLMIRLPSARGAGDRAKVGGHLDVAPTVLSLLGEQSFDAVMLGHDLTDDGSGLAVFRDGSFAYDQFQYIRRFAPTGRDTCFRIGDLTSVDCRSLLVTQDAAAERLRASDTIVHHNLIGLLSDRLVEANAR